jgi:hypothetical protein
MRLDLLAKNRQATSNISRNAPIVTPVMNAVEPTVRNVYGALLGEVVINGRVDGEMDSTPDGEWLRDSIGTPLGFVDETTEGITDGT